MRLSVAWTLALIESSSRDRGPFGIAASACVAAVTAASGAPAALARWYASRSAA